MVPVWKLTALVFGTSVVDNSGLMWCRNPGVKVEVPLLSVAIEGNGHKILVDTGIKDPEWVTDNVCPSKLTKAQQHANALAGMGWAIEDVDMVINTHLHYDHCGGNCLFKKAKFVVSKKEWAHAFDPMPHQRLFYKEDDFDHRAVNYFQWQFTEGEEEILPGICVFPTPGHTPGHISVLVNTKEGPVCLAGDESNTVQNMMEQVINNITSDPQDAIDSFAEIKKRANIFIPGHDPAIKMYQTTGFPRWM